MQTAAPVAAVPAPASPYQRQMVALMMSLFFAFGFCTVLVDTLIPKLKAMFDLSYTQVMLTQFCFFFAYFVVSLPAGWLLTRIGYLKGVAVGLIVMAGGALLFVPAAKAGLYEGFLAALFVLATGVTVVQVAANPLTAASGDPAKAPARLTLAQAFNSLATMVGPIFGAALILRDSAPTPAAGSSIAVIEAYRQVEAQALQGPFIGIAIGLLLLAALCWALRKRAPVARAAPMGGFGHLLSNRRLMLGTLSIFAYVGAEVSIGSMMTNYLMQPSTLAAPAQLAGSLVSIYWGLAMVGRFIGAVVLRKTTPGLVLMACAVGAGLLATTSGLTAGVVAAGAVLAIGLCNSIMFPTIFTLAIEGLGDETPEASGLLCLAIVGGAIVPVATGFAADHIGLHLALFVPVVCYVWIATYGWLTARTLK